MSKTFPDVETAIDELAKEHGCSEGQRADLCVVLKNEFRRNADGSVGYTPLYKNDVAGLPIEDPRVWEYLKAKRSHSFPAVVSEGLAARALTNLTAKGQLYREVGAAEAERQMEAAKGAKAAPGAKLENQPSNPWSAAGWSLTKQGQLVKSLGLEKAAGIARAAGCVIGSTKPARAA